MRCTYLLCGVLFILSYCRGQNTQKTILDTVSTTEDLKILSSLLVNSTSQEIKNVLTSKEQYTLFAPENLAFSTTNIDTLDPISLSNLLKYHIIPGVIRASDLKNSQLLPTLLSDPSLVNLPNGKSQVLPTHNSNDDMSIANASIIKAGLEASNGIIHIIDKVLSLPDKPSQLISTESTRTFSDILVKTNIAGLIDSLKGVTVFVPVENAFNSIDISNLNETALSDMIKFHVASPAVVYSTEFSKTQKLNSLQSKSLTIQTENGTSFVNGIEILATDMIASNGVIHLISGVLTPKVDYNATSSENSTQDSTRLNNPTESATGFPSRPSVSLNAATTRTSFSLITLSLLVLLVCFTISLLV